MATGAGAGQPQVTVSSRLSPAVRTLIRRHVHSVGELELLMLLEAERNRWWSVDDVCEALACPRSWAVAQLDELTAAGLVRAGAEGWRFAPSDRELENATSALQEAYRRHAGEVVRFVFAAPGSSRAS